MTSTSTDPFEELRHAAQRSEDRRRTRRITELNTRHAELTAELVTVVNELEHLRSAN